MKTTIVYVFVYEGTRKYLNQIGVSVTALRKVHPEANIKIVCDPGTPVRVKRDLPKLLDMVDEVIVEECPESPPVARSFYLKTRMPDLVKCDFVFLDADTLPILPFYEDMAAGDCDIAMVQDRSHYHPIEPHFPEFVVPKMEEMGWPTHTRKYYNTGVGFYRNTPGRDKLVAKWQQLWWDRWKKIECEGDDQICFNVAVELTEASVRELPICFNAMVAAHPRHARDARIYHFFAGNKQNFGDSLFGHLVQHYELNQEVDWPTLNKAVAMQYPWMPPYWPKHLWQAGLRMHAIKHWVLNRIGRGK